MFMNSQSHTNHQITAFLVFMISFMIGIEKSGSFQPMYGTFSSVDVDFPLEQKQNSCN